jgi:solute carrier family 45, member 1/2/4
MLLFAIIAMFSNLVLPILISSPERTDSDLLGHLNDTRDIPSQVDDCSREEIERENAYKLISVTKKLSMLLRVLRCLSFQGISIPHIWAASQILASAILLSISFSRSLELSTFLVSLLGISWASTQWAPLALISSSIVRQQFRPATCSGEPPHRNPRAPHFDRISHDPTFSDEGRENEWCGQGEEISIEGEVVHAGAVLGLYNAAIAAPQIVAGLWSSGMFWLLGKWDIGTQQAVSYMIRSSALVGIVSAWYAFKIEAEQKDALEG